jgi:D-tyrosyl-tRNA(Tyr) deacylase
MKCLIQRVLEAKVTVDGNTRGAIGEGLLVLVGFEPGDSPAVIKKMAERLCDYRVFSDIDGRMNLSVRAIEGALLLVPQFTIAADTQKGLRPSFTSAATPAEGKRHFETLVDYLNATTTPIATGVFGADMRVHLVNNGPVTFLLESR